MRRLIVCGTYRSGTTLVQKTIDAHSRCAVVMQPALPLFRHLRRWLHRAGAPVSAPDGPLGVEFTAGSAAVLDAFRSLNISAEDVARVLEDIAAMLGSLHGAGDPDAVPPRFVEELRARLRPGPVRQSIAGLFDALRVYRRAEDVAWVGLKDVYIEEMLNVLLADDPALRVVLVIRDPRAVLASRNYGKYPTGIAGPNLHPLLLIARMWNTAARWHRALAERYPRQVLALRFENVVADTHAFRSKVFGWMGLADEPNSALIQENGSPWGGNSSHPGGETRAGWQNVLPPAAVGALEFLCADEMAALGYAPAFDIATRRREFASYQEDDQALVPWTRRPDLLLSEGVRARWLELDRQSHPPRVPS